MARFRGSGGRFAKGPKSTGVMVDTLTPGIALKGLEISAEVNLLMYRMSQEMQAWAQENRVWTDRTTDAREGLTGELKEDLNKPTIYLYHTVYYGLYLELRWSGKYAIIMPTIEHFGPQLMHEIRAVI